MRPAIFSLIVAWLGSSLAGAAQPLRVWVACGPALARAAFAESIAPLTGALAGAGAVCTVAAAPEDGGTWDFSGLGAADAAVIWVHGRPAGELGRRALTDFVAAGKGLVILGAQGGAWTDWNAFEPRIEGARFGERIADGAPLRTIQLLPHAIYTGVDSFDPSEPMRQCALEPGSWVLMEGTAGEATVPLAWMRPTAAGRIVSFQPGSAADLRDPAFLRMVTNSVLWAARRPMPGAPVLVQRTYLNGAYPGALAVTFPGGPSLCYDIVRGGVNYLWDGDFVDLHPWFTAKHGEPIRNFGAVFPGEQFYRENTLVPAMHVGTDQSDSPYRYRGYRIKGDAVEFHYTVGGREIRETLRATSDGVGLVRSFQVEPGPGPLWLRLPPGIDAGISVEGARRDGSYIRFDSEQAGEFLVTMREHE